MNTVHDDIARSLAEGMDLDCTTLHLLTHGHRRSEYAVRGRDGLPLVIEIRRVVHRGGVVVRVMPARSSRASQVHVVHWCTRCTGVGHNNPLNTGRVFSWRGPDLRRCRREGEPVGDDLPPHASRQQPAQRCVAEGWTDSAGLTLADGGGDAPEVA